MKFQLTDKGELDFKWFFGLNPEDQTLAMLSLKEAQDVEGMRQLEAALSHAVLFLYDKHKANKGEMPKALEKDVKQLAEKVRAAPPTNRDDISTHTDPTPVSAPSEGERQEMEKPKKRKNKHHHCVIF